MFTFFFAVAVAVKGASLDATVDMSNVVVPAVNPYYMGCHSDYGFVQTPRGFSANMVYQPSFGHGTEGVSAWTTSAAGAPSARFSMATTTSFAAKPSFSMSSNDADGEIAAVNRGIAGSGFYLEAGKPYEVEAWVWAASSFTGFLELRERDTNESLARAEFQVAGTGPPWGATWLKVNATLTPTRGTHCPEVTPSQHDVDCPGTNGLDRICVRCGGELLVGAKGKAMTNLGYVSLMPGAWGRVVAKDGSLTAALKSAGDVLTEMGITLMRSGGSVSQSMRWKDWRGPAWNRPSNQQIWGQSELAGWGPFEVIDFCNALDIKPVITLAYESNSVQDWADLVEYAWGDGNTDWGKQRIADGHAQPYNVTAFELGNEQYNPFFVEQAAAMEAKSKELGTPPLVYIFPSNDGMGEADEKAAMAAKLPADRIAPDIHVGPGGAMALAAGVFKGSDAIGFKQSAVNMETNAGTHHLERGLEEAADLLTFFSTPPELSDRMLWRTASFCSETSSQYDGWDQGISMFLPNMTWIQPPGYVHKMITETWADVTVQSTISNATTPFIAQHDTVGNTLVLRIVNDDNVQSGLTVHVKKSTRNDGSSVEFGKVTASYIGQLAAGTKTAEVNTPAQPTLYSPQPGQAAASNDGTVTVTLAPRSFTVVVVSLV